MSDSYRKIAQSFNDKDVLLIFFDVPPEPTSKTISVNLLNRPAKFRSGVIRMLAGNDVNYVKFRLGYNFQNGRRRLEISPPVK